MAICSIRKDHVLKFYAISHEMTIYSGVNIFQDIHSMIKFSLHQ